MYRYTTLRGARLVIPTTFEECLTYGQKQEYMWKVIKELLEENEELKNRISSNTYSINGIHQNIATINDQILDLISRVEKLEEKCLTNF